MAHPAHYSTGLHGFMRESEASYKLPPLSEYENWCRLRYESIAVKSRGKFLKSIMNEPKKLRGIALAMKKGINRNDIGTRYGLSGNRIYAILCMLPEELK